MLEFPPPQPIQFDHGAEAEARAALEGVRRGAWRASYGAADALRAVVARCNLSTPCLPPLPVAGAEVGSQAHPVQPVTTTRRRPRAGAVAAAPPRAPALGTLSLAAAEVTAPDSTPLPA